MDFTERTLQFMLIADQIECSYSYSLYIAQNRLSYCKTSILDLCAAVSLTKLKEKYF